MNLNGIMLLSSVLNFETISFDPGNDLPYILYLPSYTASACYHKKLPKDLQGDLKKAIAESQNFAFGEYSAALLKGDTLPARERTQIAQKLARYTGIPAATVEATGLDPGPVLLMVRNALPRIDEGDVLEVTGGNDGLADEIGGWCRLNGCEVVASLDAGAGRTWLLRKGPAAPAWEKPDWGISLPRRDGRCFLGGFGRSGATSSR